MKRGRFQRFFPSRIRITRGHELCAILSLWIYDLIKFWLFKEILAGQGIDPRIFLFYDMVTVPLFIIGSARLVNALAGEAMAWHRVLGWGGVVLFNTLLPYGYAAWAGRAAFKLQAWALFWCLVVLVLANVARTIHGHVRRLKNSGQGGGESFGTMGTGNQAGRGRLKKKRVPSSGVEENPTFPPR